MISANDVMKKIERNDDWVTVYGMEDWYDLEASSYYAESDDELVISLSYLGDAADLALKALQETSRIGGARVLVHALGHPLQAAQRVVLAHR